MNASLHLDKMPFLRPDQRAAAKRVLLEEAERADHLVVALSGSHAYGFPSPDSDLDLKGTHVIATDELLGLGKARTSYDRLEVLDGVEIDYTCNEVGALLAGILAGNGNYVERVLGPHLCVISTEHAQLAELTRAALSRRVHHHYRGFAAGQAKAFAATETPTVKKLLYVLRTALTGTHLLLTGELLTDLRTTAKLHGVGGIAGLIELKQDGELTVLPDRDRWSATVQQAFELLEQARQRCALPDEPTNLEEINHWLVELRRSR